MNSQQIHPSKRCETRFSKKNELAVMPLIGVVTKLRIILEPALVQALIAAVDVNNQDASQFSDID